jgi:cytochrome c oxidase cbb3-type subunit 3
MNKLSRLKAFGMMLLMSCSYPLAAGPNGKALYIQHCEACHQTGGEGGIGLTLSSNKLEHVSDEYLARTIRYGRPGRIMPAYRNLSDAQVEAIVRYMRHWSGKPAMQFADSAVAGNVENGEGLYKKHCSKCHADDGSGEGLGTGVTKSRERRFMIMPAAIDNAGYHDSVTDLGIRQIIIADREDSEMPSMAGKLTDSEIDDVVAFVRTLKKPYEPVDESGLEAGYAFVVESPNDFDTTLERLREALEGSNFRIFPERFVEQGIAADFIQNTRQVQIRFCNFSTLYDMLRIEPRLGVILPCSISVMEREDGSVVMSAPNVMRMLIWFNNDELKEMGEKMQNSIISVLDEVSL